MTQRASSAQRNLIKLLLKRADFDHRRVTLMYRRIAVEDAWQGKSTDEWLDSLDGLDAHMAITKLQEIVGPDEDDDD